MLCESCGRILYYNPPVNFEDDLAQPASFGESLSPVPDSILSRLFQADEDAVRDLALELPPTIRLRLAMFCYGRSHLREKGYQLASACEEAALLKAGEPGARLAQACAEQSRTGRTIPKVTLATAKDMRRGCLWPPDLPRYHRGQ